MKSSVRVFLSVCMLAGGISAASAENPAAADISGRLQLFVDRHGIEELDGAELRLHPPRRQETAIAFDAAWEAPTSAYVTVFHDPGPSDGQSSGQNAKQDRYRMYYRGARGPDKVETTCYAESPDGINWTKPVLGLHEWDGSKENNIIRISVPPDRTSHNFAPFRDENPEAGPEARYKAIAGSGVESGLHAFRSTDGIHWQRMQRGPVITQGKFDSQNVAHWDSQREKYVCYFRILTDGVRAIAFAESDDFVNWSEPVPIRVEGEPEHFYTNATWPYFRGPHYRLAFPKRFVPGRRRLDEHPQSGISDAVFLTSRDGLHFDREFTQALIRPGRDPRNWGDRNLMTAWGLLPTGDDEMSIYVSENYRHETTRLTRFTFRTDGIASVHSGGRRGEVITTPFRLSTARRLVLNFATSAAGSVQVEVQDADGTPVPGSTLEEGSVLYGDEIAEPYAWEGGTDISSLAGRPLRLRIVLRDADVYSYRFE